MAINNYNAETAWDYLRGGTGAYDYSAMPKYAAIFQSINQETPEGPQTKAKGVKRLPNFGTKSGSIPEINELTSSILGNEFLNNLTDTAVNFPSYALQAGLAGKYMNPLTMNPLF